MKKRLKNSKATVKPVVHVDPSDPHPDAIRLAVDVLRQKGVVVFPTTGLYGLGADALARQAVRKIFAIKRRPAGKPVLVLLSGLLDMKVLVRTIPDYAEPLLSLWPGGITLVFEAADAVPAELTGGTGKIGVRLPAHPVAKALLALYGGPITGTSANLTDHPAAARVSDLASEIRNQTDLILDAGSLAGGPGSTILDASTWPVKVLREGAVPRSAIDSVLNRT